MIVGKPGRGRQNEEGAWGFGVGGIRKGLRAWAPSRNAVYLLASSRGGKKR